MRRRHNAVATTILLALAAAPAIAQPSITSIGGSVSHSLWRLRNAGQTIRLTREADSSPVPSDVTYSDATRSNSLWYGAVARLNENQAAFVETNYLSTGNGFVSGALGGYGVVFDGTPERALSFNGGLYVTVAYLWGDIGTVGSRAGDRYLIAPDGNQFEAGAKISTRALSLGGDATVGVSLRIASQMVLAISGGYRAVTPVTEWKYQVREESDDARSDLPAAGFGAAPPKLEMSGVLARVGLQFSLPGSSSRSVWGHRR